MSCTAPEAAVLIGDKMKFLGHKYYLSYVSRTPTPREQLRLERLSKHGIDLSVFPMPCGSCMGCRIVYSRDYALRGVCEAELSDFNYFITLTYEDNEFLSQSEVDSILDYKQKGFHNPTLPFESLFKEENIKSNYWSNKWKVYGLGMVGNLDGVVFDNWQQIDIIPEDARLLGIGMDFGYSNDPTAIVEVYKWNDKRILNEICYKKGLVNSDIADYLPKNIMVYADCAEPKSIEEIKRLGINMIQGVSKGADSINFGIQLMQEQNYLVTRKSVNVIEELQKYTWKKDKKTNDKLNKPIDKYNHAIDAIRYHEMETLASKQAFFIM